jgi:hypothetical protein
VYLLYLSQWVSADRMSNWAASPWVSHTPRDRPPQSHPSTATSRDDLTDFGPPPCQQCRWAYPGFSPAHPQAHSSVRTSCRTLRRLSLTPYAPCASHPRAQRSRGRSPHAMRSSSGRRRGPCSMVLPRCSSQGWRPRGSRGHVYKHRRTIPWGLKWLRMSCSAGIYILVEHTHSYWLGCWTSTPPLPYPQSSSTDMQWY